MNLKDLQNLNKSTAKESLKTINEKLESSEFVDITTKERERIQHPVDYTDPSNFALYGSAKKYYVDSITNIYATFPYDGSKKERQEWRNNASDLDLYVIDNLYPKTAGSITLNSSSYHDENGDIFVNTVTGYDSREYPTSENPQYVIFYGGPNYGETFEKSNLIDTATNSFCNLDINGANGNTVEFWLKKDSSNSSLNNQAVLDIWNGLLASDDSYGRFTIELLENVNPYKNNFVITYVSGANKTHRHTSFEVTKNNLSSWNHYSFVIKNNGNDLSIAFYINGEKENSSTVSSAAIFSPSLLNVTGTIGAYQTDIENVILNVNTGSAYISLDEFRFWKSERNQQQIRENLYSHVGGGTNTDDENVSLGVYYKFNEGINNDNSYDSTCLDYSGRISNGYIVNYSSEVRTTDSAMESNNSDIIEPKDPIIYKNHSDVQALLEQYEYSGSVYDDENVNALINTIPSWILEEEQREGRDELANLIQIMSSYLDTLHIQTQYLSKIKYSEYSEGKHKAYPLYKRFLGSYDFDVGDIFNEASFSELVLSKNDNINFEETLDNVKNEIYRNIYNNLSYIYKTKGTIKSFRNLLRCFGIDESILKVNIYSDNSELQFNHKTEESTYLKKYLNLNSADRFSSTVFQYTSITDGTEAGYIGHSHDDYFSLIPSTKSAFTFG